MKQFGSIFAVLIMVVLLLAGCSGKPSNTGIEQALFAYYHVNKSGIGEGDTEGATVKNVIKLNGFEHGENGYIASIGFDLFSKVIKAHYEGEITLIKSEKGWVEKGTQFHLVSVLK